MKVAVVSRDEDLISRYFKIFDFKKVSRDPDMVIALGGDGTFLYAEQKYPGVPKVFIYHGSLCEDCREHDFSKILSKIRRKDYAVHKFMKLSVSVKGEKFLAMNDVNIHYVPPTALRYEVAVGGAYDSYIGDGVVIATPYGSSAYFSSISNKKFKTGIGVAINNSTKGKRSFVVKEGNQLKIKIMRGPGVLAVDCNKKIVHLKAGDKVVVKKARSFAKVLKFRGYNLKIKKI
ncbi:MAG: hypothetical protein U9R08_00415 [Nanoarchaeota archaeon]|nr:hypothetical protein [Nanoarchaeota archaeon]